MHPKGLDLYVCVPSSMSFPNGHGDMPGGRVWPLAGITGETSAGLQAANERSPIFMKLWVNYSFGPEMKVPREPRWQHEYSSRTDRRGGCS